MQYRPSVGYIAIEISPTEMILLDLKIISGTEIWSVLVHVLILESESG